MRARKIAIAVAGGIIGGYAWWMISSFITDSIRENDRETHQACLIPGEVPAGCLTLYPSIRRCVVEDCSDITAPYGYWVDGDRVWLVRAPWTLSARQSPSEAV